MNLARTLIIVSVTNFSAKMNYINIYINYFYSFLLFYVSEETLKEIQKTACSSKPFCPNILELKLGILGWLKEKHAEVLHDEVEILLNEKGHKVLWLLPNYPELQPIEIFWGISKIFVANHFYNGRTMKATISQIREKWYGSNRIKKLPDIIGNGL